MDHAETLRNTQQPKDVATAADGARPHSTDADEAEALENERQLAARATDGDRQAYSQLYERYVDKIYKYIYYKVGGHGDAEDLTSQTFLKAWDAIGDYEWRNYPFGAWLFRIAHNLVVDYHRARREMTSLDDANPRLEHEATSYEIRPERVIAQFIAEGRIRQAIDRLTDEQQQVLILRFFEGLDTGEVAELMGKRRGAVRGLQFRALAALRDLLEREQDELI